MSLTCSVDICGESGHRGADCAGFGIGIATVYRYVREVTDLLAAQAPTLAERGLATPKTWRILTRARCTTHRVTTLTKAIHTLEHHH